MSNPVDLSIPLRRFPNTLTILPTYRCTAACINCCFDSNPHVQGQIPLESMRSYIDQATELSSIRLLVISGGEPFLLGNDLEQIISYAANRGLRTRVVTNGYWATSTDSAGLKLRSLLKAGLNEINFSTGDYHAQFVPVERVIWGVDAAVNLKMHTAIAVEQQGNRMITPAVIRSHPLIADLISNSERSKYFTLVQSQWMSREASVQGLDARAVDPGPNVRADPETLLTRSTLAFRSGCPSVLASLVITPYRQVGACCGLPREEIEELNMGSVDERSLSECYEEARTDFMKLWLATEGPEHILAWAAEHDSRIQWENRYAHPCDACRALYKDPKVRKVIEENYQEKMAEVLLRFVALEKTNLAE